MRYLKLFDNHEEYTAYTADTSVFVKPNVSHCIEEDEVHYIATIVKPTAVSIDESSIKLDINETKQLTATITPPNVTDKQVTWESSDPTIATVDENGVVSANSYGDCTITVTTHTNHLQATCNVTVEKDWTKTYFTVNMKTSTGQVRFNQTVEVSVNGGNWETVSPGWYPSSAVAVGTKLAFRGTNTSIKLSGSTSSGGKLILEGNPMSLLFGESEFRTARDLTSKPYAFNEFMSDGSAHMFINEGNLVLPATTLGDSAYRGMFRNASSLGVAPELPATVAGSSAYRGMFSGCTSITVAPAINLIDGGTALYDMFKGCTSLVEAASMDSLTSLGLSGACYMYSGCTSLTTAKAIPATTFGNYAYVGMYKGCTSLVNVPQNMLPVTTLSVGCYNSMFYGCTAMTTAPDLPAPTIVNNCYYQTFYNCSSLNAITCLAENPEAEGQYNFLYGVAGSGTFTKKAGVTWQTGGNYGIPNGWTVVEA